MTYLYLSIIKALHIIFMVSYFAGIFYLVRIFVYYKDTDDFESPKKEVLREQYVFMARRLWNIITVPAFVLMTVFGIWMLFYYYPEFPLLKITKPLPWFYVKIIFLIGLFIYHYWCWKKVLEIKNLNGKELPTANLKLRQSNEIATFLLFLVVFVAILKSLALEYWWQLIVGFFVIVFVIMITVKMVNKKKRE